MSITGEPGRGPMRAGIPVADLTAGLFAAIGILIALLERERSGEGQWVKSSLLGAQISMLDFQAARWTIAKEVPEQAGNNHPTAIPSGVFATADGFINVAAIGDDIYDRLCTALGADHLATDPLFATGRARSNNRDALNEAIEAITRGKSSADWIEALNSAGVPSGPIYKMNEVFADPQVKHLAMTHIVPHKVLGELELIGQPIELSRTPWSIHRATPEPGEHTDAVLSELGYSAEEITALHTGKVV